jgi:hypothetical protein
VPEEFLEDSICQSCPSWGRHSEEVTTHSIIAYTINNKGKTRSVTPCLYKIYNLFLFREITHLL